MELNGGITVTNTIGLSSRLNYLLAWCFKSGERALKSSRFERFNLSLQWKLKLIVVDYSNQGNAKERAWCLNIQVVVSPCPCNTHLVTPFEVHRPGADAAWKLALADGQTGGQRAGVWPRDRELAVFVLIHLRETQKTRIIYCVISIVTSLLCLLILLLKHFSFVRVWSFPSIMEISASRSEATWRNSARWRGPARGL